MAPSAPLPSSTREIFQTVFNFTRSDYKTIFFPVIFYGLAATPKILFGRLPLLALWVWLHLLQFCTANQMFSRQEDSINKPYRPIPAGLISVRNTKILRWILVPACLSLSWTCDVLYPGISLAVAFGLYNEFGLDSVFYTKNVLNAIGIVSWNVGAAKIAGAGFHEPGSIQYIAPYICTFLIATTIHVQDFRDEAGDRQQGRRTFPVLLPALSRQVTFVLMSGWSFGLAAFWARSFAPVPMTIFVLTGTYIGVRVLTQRTEPEDKVTLRFYMVRQSAMCVPSQH
ncbi:UbiA prenyltransferase family [Mycena vitilis]|nr:UbiA prenyltransferase family [Mycena vitilis]